MKTAPLRSYQKRDLAALRDALTKEDRALFTAVTGYGKTRVAGDLALDAQAEDAKFIFLAPWRELIPQTIERFEELGLRAVGIMMSGYTPDPDAPIIVGSIETVRRWAPRYPELLRARYIVADEAHRYGSDLRRELLSIFKNAKLIGLTATPFRADRGGLGDMFDVIVNGAPMQELIDKGYLVPPVFYSRDPESLRAYRVAKDSPFKPAPFTKRRQPHMVGDVVEEWATIGDGKTLCFANSVKQSKEYAEQFRALGVVAEHVDALTPNGERDAILERFRTGETQIVCNHGVLCEGYDLPNIQTVILKKTGSLRDYLQMVGRGLRSSDNKTHCVVIDPGGNVYRFGFPQDYREYTLDGAPKEKPLPSPDGEGGGPPRPSGKIYAQANLEHVDALPDDAQSVLRRLEAQAEASGYGMPWAIAEFRRQFDGQVPAGAKYRKEVEKYYRRQAKASGLPMKWAKARTRALFS